MVLCIDRVNCNKTNGVSLGIVVTMLNRFVK